MLLTKTVLYKDLKARQMLGAFSSHPDPVLASTSSSSLSSLGYLCEGLRRCVLEPSGFPYLYQQTGNEHFLQDDSRVRIHGQKTFSWMVLVEGRGREHSGSAVGQN
jgi:hypothetical protein